MTRGDLRTFPAGGGTPAVSTLNWEAGILALANAAVVPLGSGGAITLQVDGLGAVNYIVHGVRRAFKDFDPVAPGDEFMPKTPNETLAAGLPAEIRQRLISMGIYNPDGTVNSRMAERMRWAQKWRDDAKRRQDVISRVRQETGRAPGQ